MKVNPRLISTLYCTGFLFATQASIASQVVVPLNAVNNYSTIPNRHANNYIIQAGVFDVYANAQNYAATLKAQTSTPIRIVPKYHVMVGPFNNVNTMKKVGRQLSHAKPHAHRVVARRASASHYQAKTNPTTKSRVIPTKMATTTTARNHHHTYQPKKQLSSVTTTKQANKSTVNNGSLIPVLVPLKPTNNRAVSTTAPRAYSATYPKPSYVGQVWKDMELPVALYQTGPYLGASIGVQGANSGVPTWYRGLQGTLSAGLGHMFTQRFYVAGELFAGDSIQLKNKIASGAPQTQSVRTGWSYGVDLIPGFMITDTVLMYVRGGGVVTQFNEAGYTKLGWQVGLGGQTNLSNLCKNLDLRAEYIFSLYPKMSTLGRAFTEQFNLGLVYKFI